MKQLTIIIILTLLAILAGWLVSVGLFGAIQWLVNATFDTSYSFNVWLGGTLLYLVWYLIKSLTK